MIGGTGVIDSFTNTFATYIDSGFGLLHGEVTYLASTLIAIDITLAGLFWAWGADDDIMARLVRKTLFIGFFAFIIGNFDNLAKIIFNSFAGLGLEAVGSTVSATNFVHPGSIAQVGIDAGKPILVAAGQLMGFTSFFDNFILIFILLLAWVVVLIAFFIIAIQLFVTLIEFKLTTLAGFVLVPFGLFSKTAFLAEKVLGNIAASGVKVLVLAVIIGIGTTLFSQFTTGFPSNPNIEDALSIMLAALTLLGLSIFGPGIATGLISGAPQLGAGAAVGTGLAAGGMAMAAVAGAGMVGGGVAALGGAAAAGARGGAAIAGGATAAYRAGGASSVVSTGFSKGAEAVMSPLRRAAASLRTSFESGAQAASGGGQTGAADAAGSSSATTKDNPPGWARRMKRSQTMSHGASAAAHIVRSGDQGGGGASVDLSQGE